MKTLITLLAVFLVACGGGGEMDGEVKTQATEEPPCKSIPVERRAAECGT